MNSILQVEKECLICGTKHNLHCHHVFEGSNRKKSEQYGLKVYLCANHHNMTPNSVHMNENMNKRLKFWAQVKAIKHYGWTTEEFIKIIGKSYEV